MPIRMIAVDLDGTLLGGTEGRYGFLPEGTAALRKAASSQARIAIVSGRDFEFIEGLLAREGVFVSESGWPHIVIAEERFLYRLRGGRYEPDREWNEAIGQLERMHFERIRSGVEALLAGDVGSLDGGARRQEEALERRRGFVEVSFTDPRRAQAAVPLFEAWLDGLRLPYSIVRNVADVCVRHRSVGKGVMLDKVCREWGIAPSEVLAVGDSANDLSMLDGRFGFIGACPGNAEASVKDAVGRGGGYIAEGRYGQGVADAVNRYMNGGL